ncbi:MAG: tetratricopeptide repeat protein [Planctomycetota bacterium]
MDEVQPLPEPRKTHGLLIAVTFVALVAALAVDVWLILRADGPTVLPPGETDPARAGRLFDEASSKALAGAPADDVLPLLDQAIDASPTLTEARVLRVKLLLPRYIERWAVLDASPCFERARIPADAEIDRLRTRMLSDAAAIGAASIAEEARSEALAVESFLTDKPVASGASPRTRVLRAWQLLLEGKARPAMKECDRPESPTDPLERWTLAHCLLAVRSEEPWRDAMADSARELLASLPASAAVLIDRAEADPSHASDILAQALATSPGEPSILALLAEAEERAGAFAQALAWACQATDVAPDEPGLLLLRARLHARLGQVGFARETYDRVRRIAPDRADVLRARAAFLFRTGDGDKALGDAERAVQIEPTQASCSVLCEALVVTGQAEQAKRRTEVWDLADPRARSRVLLALRDYDTITGRGGAPPEGDILALSLAALATGDLRQAEMCAESLKDADGWEALARVRVAQGRALQAPDLLRKALAADPLRAPCQALLGHVLLGLGKPQEAEEALARAVEIDPTCAEAWRGMGELRLAQGLPEEALKALDQAVENGHGDPEDLCLRADLRRRRGDTEGALADIDLALRAKADHGPWLALRAEVKLSRNDAKGAREDAEKACGALRESASAWATLARADFALADLDATEKSLERAFLLDLRHVAARVCSARLALARSQREKARSELGIALNVDPDDADALHLRAKIAVEDARWQEAADDLERFLLRHHADPRGIEARGWLDLAKKGLRDR